MSVMKRKASARWEGGIKDGGGTLTLQSGAFEDQKYSFHSRFKDEKGTNPEELIGAAHAGCFAMALSKILGDAGHAPERIEAEATVSLDTGDGSPSIAGIHLLLKAKVPGVDREALAAFGRKAKDNCPVSRALSVPISLDTEPL